MRGTVDFLLNSLLLGVGLSMDAFSVSLVNGLREPGMPVRRACLIAGVYGAFQAGMPLLGWALVRGAAERFQWFAALAPWIGAVLLLRIGYGMLRQKPGEAPPVLGTGTLLAQGLATSIDALSVGFAVAEYGAAQAVGAAGIIAAVTFFVCCAGVSLGRRFGAELADRAPVAGGLILMGIGVELAVRTML